MVETASEPPLVSAMANEEHLKVLQEGVPAWNGWRKKNPELRPDLSGANLRGKVLDDEHLYDPTLKIYPNDPTLIRIDLHNANLTKIDLTHAFLHKADLCQADLTEATLVGTNFCQAQLRHAILTRADLHRANLDRADLTDADLSEANLERTILVSTKVSRATFTACRVYGASAWDLDMEDVKDQSNLRIMRGDKQGLVTVDDLEVAQFVYMLEHNQKIRRVIDTITSKAVLILGHFSEERKVVLDALRKELRQHNYVPILFDFSPSPNRDTVETVKTLAGMARFIIADLTDAKSVLQELQAIVPDFPSVAVRFLIKKPQYEPGMLDHIRKFPWVIKGAYEYEREGEVIASIKEQVILPAEAKVRKLRPPKKVRVRRQSH